MSTKLKLQTLSGMHDMLPEDQPYLKKINKSVESIANYYSFGRIDTPVLENAEIFAKGTGAGTDIVERVRAQIGSETTAASPSQFPHAPVSNGGDPPIPETAAAAGAIHPF